MGIVLWEALTGERLFLGNTDVDTVIKVRKGEVPAIRDLRPDVPPLMSEVVHGALARDPKERFDTAKEMHRALAAILRTHPEPTDADPLGKSVREALARLPKKLAGKIPPKR
jgi:serine/threonine-protein kinase